MPTRDEMIAALRRRLPLGACDCEDCIGAQADAVLALLAAEPGVAVPEPDEQRLAIETQT